MTNTTYSSYELNEIVGMHRDESCSFKFDEPFEVEYRHGGIKTMMVSKVTGYYWDEDDHIGPDFWLWEDGKQQWTCKLYYLTMKSRKKLFNIIKQTMS